MGRTKVLGDGRPGDLKTPLEAERTKVLEDGRPGDLKTPLDVGRTKVLGDGRPGDLKTPLEAERAKVLKTDIVKKEISTQTEVSLKSVQTNVIWTPSVLDTVLDVQNEVENIVEMESDNEDNIVETGKLVDMLDNVEEAHKASHINDTGEQSETEALNITDEPKQSEMKQTNMCIYLLLIMFVVTMIIICATETTARQSGNQDSLGNRDEPILTLQNDSNKWSKVGPKGKTMKPAVKVRKMRLKKGITMDSGAANNVMPKRMVVNKNRIRPSPGSLRNAHYIAANNGKIPNEGEFDFEFTTTEGQEKSICFQVAEVNKALGSISYMVDHQYRIIFDKDEKTGTDLSLMIHKPTGVTTRFRRQRNVWILDAIIEVDDQSFRRHA